MRKIFNLLLACSLLLAFAPEHAQEQKKTPKASQNMLCQGEYFTEQQGKDFLATQKKSYTTQKDWEKRAKLIKEHILKGTGLTKFPKKCPLNPIIGAKRVFDGYQVQNCLLYTSDAADE